MQLGAEALLGERWYTQGFKLPRHHPSSNDVLAEEPAMLLQCGNISVLEVVKRSRPHSNITTLLEYRTVARRKRAVAAWA